MNARAGGGGGGGGSVAAASFDFGSSVEIHPPATKVRARFIIGSPCLGGRTHSESLAANEGRRREAGPQRSCRGRDTPCARRSQINHCWVGNTLARSTRAQFFDESVGGGAYFAFELRSGPDPILAGAELLTVRRHCCHRVPRC
jgi:hypothetical protein